MKPVFGELRTQDAKHHHAYRLAHLLDVIGTWHGERRDETTVGALLGLAEDMAIALRDALETDVKGGAA